MTARNNNASIARKYIYIYIYIYMYIVPQLFYIVDCD